MQNLSVRNAIVPRVFCIGRNYAEHAHELQHEIPKVPVIFIKPSTCLVPVGNKIHVPKHGFDLQHEAEVVIKIGRDGKAETADETLTFISGLTLGLDLTLRDLQKNLKAKGLPWEIAKSFDQSAPIGEFVNYSNSLDLREIEFTCRVNGLIRQQGKTRDMIFSFEELIIEINKIWTLHTGDLIYTGTPSGVGPLKTGDVITLESAQLGAFTWEIID
jgi:2-keto-4-pentenoate hydratase/2-oxohepta-3-ene-1,7-dioic acid hydratase in catechol pathway